MKFTPMSEDEIARSALFEPGQYPFEVLAASDEISKSGNEMIKLKLAVYGNDGNQIHVYDYLLEKLQFKLRHFAEAAGLLADYERGALESFSCDGKQGYLKLGIDKGGNGYPPKNTVLDYIKPEKAPSISPVKMAGPDVPRKLKPEEFAAKHGIDTGAKLDDDIPF